MKRTKKILLALLFIFIVMQFIPPSRNTSTADQQGDFIELFNVPANVAGILKTSCYDCHSSNTRYPWYANIQPFGWLLANHIEEGKRELNFSAFASYSIRRQASKLQAVAGSVKDSSMPLSSYTLIHGEEELDDSEKHLLIYWFSNAKDSLDAKQYK